MILQMKSMGIQSVERFPFPSPPPKESLSAAIRCLINIGALRRTIAQGATGRTVVEKLTGLGEKLASLPVHPRLGKMLVLGSYVAPCCCSTRHAGLCPLICAAPPHPQATRPCQVHRRDSGGVERAGPVCAPAVPELEEGKEAARGC